MRTMNIITRLFGSLQRGDGGQDLIEYGLLAGFVALAVIAGVTQFGTSVENWYNQIAGQVPK